MAGLSVSEAFVIQSHKGPYEVTFAADAAAALRDLPPNTHFIVDQRVSHLHAEGLKGALSTPSTLIVEANEEKKSLEMFPDYVRHFVHHQIRQDHVLVAVGGGIIQDIACFLAATLLRGIAWHFFPTTLLAQADSCIGSKSSINCGDIKNIVGTFTPPRRAVICASFLDTLDARDMRSGIGEMLKAHAIEGVAAFESIAADFSRLLTDRDVLAARIRRSLLIKKEYIEADEFDRGIRNVFNYGHTFGHAIESATDFAVPHGIGVTLGMDMANFVAVRFGLSLEAHFRHMHGVLAENFVGYERHPVPLDRFLSAISKDKKNRGRGQLTLILPDREGRLQKVVRPNDTAFYEACRDYLDRARGQ